MRRLLERLSALFPQQFLRDLSLQTTGLYVSTALQLARGLLLARLLGPASLGIYATVGIVMTYGAYADFGMGKVAFREIPLALGAGEHRKAEESWWYGLVTTTSAAFFAAVGLAVYVLVRWDSLQPDLRFGLLTTCIVLVSSALTNEQQLALRGQQRFGRLNTLVVLIAAVSLASAVAGAALAGVQGVFISQVVTFVLAAAVSFAIAGWPRSFPIHRARVWHLLRAGLPFALIAFASYNLVNIDQLMTVSMLGNEALGTYMLVLYAGSVVALFPNAVVVATGTRLLQEYGHSGTLTAIRGLTWRPVEGLSAIMPLLCALAWTAGPLGIQWFLPEYAGAIAPLRVYVVGVFFLGVNMGTSQVLFALDKHKYYVPIVAGAIGLNVAVDLLFVGVFRWGLIGVALGSVCTYFVYWLVHTTLIRHYFGQSVGHAVLQNLASAWPGYVLAAADIVAWSLGRLSRPTLWLSAALLLGAVAVSLLRWRVSNRWTPDALPEEGGPA